MGHFAGQFGFEQVLEFFVQQVGFGYGQQAGFVQEFGVVLAQFFEQGLVLAGDVVGVAGDDKEEGGVAFDVAQEAQAEPFAAVGALDDAGDVGHDEGACVAIGDDAEVGHQGGEGVVGDFGFGGGEAGQQGGFAGVGEAHQPDVGQQLELEDFPFLAARLAGLGVARGLVGGGLEVGVAQAAAAARYEDALLAVAGDFEFDLAGFGVFGYRAEGHVEHDILAVGAVAVVAAPVAAVPGQDVLAVFERQQGPDIAVASQNDVPAPPPVAAVGAAFGVAGIAMQMGRTRPPFARTATDFHVVHEVLFGHGAADWEGLGIEGAASDAAFVMLQQIARPVGTSGRKFLRWRPRLPPCRRGPCGRSIRTRGWFPGDTPRCGGG